MMDREASSSRLAERCVIVGVSLVAILAMSNTAAASPSLAAKPIALAVVPCRTSFALAQQPPRKRLPKSIVVDVPGQLATDLVVYSDTRAILRSVGPRGWTCDATFGADGSGGLLIHPNNEQVPLQTWGAGWALPRGSQDAAITALETGASSNQADGEACPYFSTAAKRMVADFGHSCTAHPKAERVTIVNSHVARFTDPAGLHGGGIPSGGKNWATGLVIYSPMARPGAYQLTCTLPRANANECAAVIDYFQTSH
jgi:hypothetical protein